MDDEIIRLAQEIRDNDYSLIKIRALIQNLLNERLPHQVIYDHVSGTDLIEYENLKWKLERISETAKQCPDCECCQLILEIIEPSILMAYT